MSNQSEVATRQAALAGAFAGDSKYRKRRDPTMETEYSSKPYARPSKACMQKKAFERFGGIPGNLSATALWISYSAIQFGCYHNMDQFWSAEILQNHPTSVHTVNGAFSGVFAAILTYPLDLFRTIFAAQGVPRRYPTISSLAYTLLQRKGVSGFFQGMGPSLFQIAPYMGLSFGIYSSLDRLSNSQSKENRVLTKWRLFSFLGNGAVSGLISKLAVYPIDTIKKRMQVQSVQPTPMYGTIQRYSSSWHCMRAIFHYEGLYGFYKGVTPSIAKSVVTQSSTFACYELGIHLIKYIESR